MSGPFSLFWLLRPRTSCFFRKLTPIPIVPTASIRRIIFREAGKELRLSPSITQLKRCLLVERLPVQDSEKELVLVNLHLEAYDSGRGKEEQTKVLVEFLKAEYEKGNYCVAGGDFNQNFPGTEDRFPLREKAGFIPGKIDPSILEGWTFAADVSNPSARLLDRPYDGDRNANQFYVIDGFVLSPNVNFDSVQTVDLDFRNSDHNPVKLAFTLN